jgi:UDP-N-acetylglucosamine--N-acetylmuramyl-(pentapeptide) pyrophosphoryl-undecaprenol N-acetylglucosamine transferase
VFISFPSASERLRNETITVSGTPVRPQFGPTDAASCRVAMGLKPDRPVLLVMGGSQGARGVNDLMVRSLSLFTSQQPSLQFIHLTGTADFSRIQSAYRAMDSPAVVRPFLSEMEIAMGAATVAVTRAGASSLAELAALQLPAVLIPYPSAADNHQFFNARAYVESGAARMLVQDDATPELLVAMAGDLAGNEPRRQAMKAALAQWHRPRAAEDIADHILASLEKNGVAIPRPGNGPVGAEVPAVRPGKTGVEKLLIA